MEDAKEVVAMEHGHRGTGGAWAAWGAACLVALLLAAPVALSAQERGRERGDGGGRPGVLRDGRSRTEDRDARGSADRADRIRTERDPSRSAFTRSPAGRRYDNGIALREATRSADRHWERYFPERTYSFPHYRTSSVSVGVVFSPFYWYGGVCPPYIDRAYVFFGRPSVVYIDVPIYVDHVWHGYRGAGDDDDYYLVRSADTRWRDDRELKRAVYDIEDAFTNSDIELLAPLTDAKTKIAIFSKGKYEYSLEPNDYLDMTRDFMRSTDTVSFAAYRVHFRTSGVYQVFAKHSYKDKDGKTRTVYLCMVLQKIDGRWTLTQIDTSPERIN